MLTSKIAAGLLVGLGFAGASQAASVSYFLDQSDKLVDGVNYLQVTIDDEGAPGAINFTVSVLQPLLDVAAEGRFGISKFAFNVVPGISVKRKNVDFSSLPKGWVYGQQQDMNGFGRFDRRLRNTNSKTPLSSSISFSIVGIDLDTIASYVELSRDSSEGPSFFSARVEGLNLPCVQRTSRSSTRGNSCKPTDAFFGGVQAVPAPPALWLLGTAVAAVAVRRFRKPGA
jgi:hypothetical protein